MAHYLDGLTEAQRAAVTHMDGPAIAVAAPGSGKTRVITFRIVHLVNQGVNPGNIVAVTFTNKAAKEMKTRVAKLLPEDVARRVVVSTFHSFCAKLLRLDYQAAGVAKNYTINDEDATTINVIQAICTHTQEDPKEVKRKEGFESVDYCKKFISLQKQNLLTPEDLLIAAEKAGQEEPRDAYLRTIYDLYQQVLERSRSLDFDDLIMKVTLLLKNNEFIRQKYSKRVKYLLVDEYQDTNHSQFVLSTQLCGHWNNIFVVLDDDQSIYKFRGADITNLTNLEDMYRDTIKTYFLQENFRSTKSIAASANAVIHNNMGRKPKSILAVGEQGDQVRCVEALDFGQEAAFAVEEILSLVKNGRAAYNDFAVIYRTHARSRLYEELMVANLIPHKVIGGVGFYNRAVVKDLLAYLKLIDNPYDDASFMRVYDAPPRGFGEKSYFKLSELKEKHQESFVEMLRNQRYADVLTSKPREGADKLKRLFDLFATVDATKVCPLVELILKETGYKSYIALKNDEDTPGRLDHIEEFIDATSEFDSSQGAGLTRFLEWTSLVQSADEESEIDKVTLMTCHAAKGLEFKHVYLIGAIEGTMPILRIVDDDGTVKTSEQLNRDLEEERRVFYVGMTRAEKSLTITYSNFKLQRGEKLSCTRSPFIDEMEGTFDLIPISDVRSVGASCMRKLNQKRDRIPIDSRRLTPRYQASRRFGKYYHSR